LTIVISWRRNLAILVVVQLLSTAGFSLIYPFLPLYVRELGVQTRGSIEFWAGMVFSAQAITMMISAPIWGAMADRRGRKLMLERATLGGAVIMVAMGFAQSAEQLAILRAMQGMVTGVIAASNALVAASTPREHLGSALGTLNMSRWVGVAAGPIIGGLLGEWMGFRASFWITGALLAVAGLCVMLFVQEDFTPVDPNKRGGFFEGYRDLIAAPGMRGLYGLTMLRSLGATLLTPILALFVLSLNDGIERGAASMTGTAIGVAAFTSAISAVYLGKLGDRIGHSRILVGSALAAALMYVPQIFVTSAWQLVAAQALAGIATGGMVPATAALMNLWAPGGRQGATYGLENSAQSAARTVAPMMSAAIAAVAGYRGVFAVNAFVYVLIAALSLWVVRAADRRQANVGEPILGIHTAGSQ
jgi:DHA1 family multidrug resistance protein-like MFS transporter